jgi:hypothetical protein
MKKMTPQQDESVARTYIDQLRHNQFDHIEGNMDSSVSGPDIPATLARMAAMFPAQEPTSVKVISVNLFRSAEITKTDLTLEYEFPQQWLLANLVTQKKDGVTTITGFYVKPIPNSLESLNRFTFAGKGVVQYTILLLALLSLLSSLYALVLCIRTKLKGKWLWLILILLGVGKLSVVWTTAQSSFSFFAVQLLSVSAIAQPYGPWVINVSIPLGALAFLIFREKSAVNRLNRVV